MEDIVVVKVEDIDEIEKDISLDEFLELYNYEIKSDEDDYERIYFPPGNIDLTMNMTTVRYSVVTEKYANFYGLDSEDSKYYVDVTVTDNAKNIIRAKVYKYDKSFNRITSRFTLVSEIKDVLSCDGYDDAIRKVISKRDSSLYKVNGSEPLPYSKIKQ